MKNEVSKSKSNRPFKNWISFSFEGYSLCHWIHLLEIPVCKTFVGLVEFSTQVAKAVARHLLNASLDVVVFFPPFFS